MFKKRFYQHKPEVCPERGKITITFPFMEPTNVYDLAHMQNFKYHCKIREVPHHVLNYNFFEHILELFSNR